MNGGQKDQLEGCCHSLDEGSWGPEPGQQGRREVGFKGETGGTTGLGMAGCGGKGGKRKEWGVPQGNGLGTTYQDREAWGQAQRRGCLEKNGVVHLVEHHRESSR